MSERKIYSFDVYNRPCAVIYDTEDGNFVLAERGNDDTIIQYPTSWNLDECIQWAGDNDFPEPGIINGNAEGCLGVGPWDNWIGNIIISDHV